MTLSDNDVTQSDWLVYNNGTHLVCRKCNLTVIFLEKQHWIIKYFVNRCQITHLRKEFITSLHLNYCENSDALHKQLCCLSSIEKIGSK